MDKELLNLYLEAGQTHDVIRKLAQKLTITDTVLSVAMSAIEDLQQRVAELERKNN